ncbi:hypothetical protein ASPCADRAFT_178571 [Aspergillus carbonarius ITEM 5010]|uniref:Leucine-rich repeat domain-containing protein n=1 Tax=Aspergillus carbonarius (strain ITEM 5010) TaxID=602072 RepID=A0A1R3R8U1_ASPC5|nr:hypothetical protein ASPCADRAFT_178571 [Aspergillus carbonarius ITEM 5010]
MRLDYLPRELVLHEIIPLLTAHDYTQLVLVCKSWYNLFIPHLYHHVMIPLNDYCGSGFGHIRSSPNLPVRRFTVALMENPTLALLIRYLELYPSTCQGKWRDRPPLKPLAEETYRLSMLPYGEAKRKRRRQFHAWRRDLKLQSERQDWYRPYRCEDAWIALLLMQVKNLEKFAMELPEERNHLNEEVQLKNSVHFERVIQWASNPKLGILTHLTHISLTNGPPFWESGTAVNAVPLNRLVPYLRIPSLRKFYVVNPCDRSSFNMPKNRDLVLPLTHLDLEAPNERLPNLPRLLERCPNLQSFTLEKGELHSEHAHNYLDYSLLYQPLRHSRFSLRHLNMTYWSDRTWQDAEIPTPAFFGSLAEFPNLQTVHMRWSNLMPFLGKAAYDPSTPLRELLPRSLQHLYIDDCLIQCSLSLCGELESLVVHFFETVPLLKMLYLRYAAKEQAPGQGCINCVGGHWSTWRKMIPNPITDGRLLDLQEKFRALDVDFRIIEREAIEREARVPFPGDGSIRKTWPWGKSGKIVGI